MADVTVLAHQLSNHFCCDVFIIMTAFYGTCRFITFDNSCERQRGIDVLLSLVVRADVSAVVWSVHTCSMCELACVFSPTITSVLPCFQLTVP